MFFNAIQIFVTCDSMPDVGDSVSSFCPCGSKILYKDCCKPLHLGKLPKNALELMRSRYSAYALCLSDYIILTTHPENPQFCTDRSTWRQKISEFCVNTKFEKLEVLDFQEKDNRATVLFVAHLTQNEKDISFKERSLFEKLDDRWLYKNGLLYDPG